MFQLIEINPGLVAYTKDSEITELKDMKKLIKAYKITK